MQFIVHEHPVGRGATNYIARADLGPFGLDGRVEQLWLTALNDGSYEVACIPFFTYGLGLGDTVLLNENDYVGEVVGTSWHRVLRILITPDLPSADLEKAVAEVKAEIVAAGLLSEWSGDRFAAVDVPPGDEPSKLFAVTETTVTAGVAFWEWADAMPLASTP
ncbi:DUF4265 domain-containing protein [Embleya sp. NBC_00896]|uniref:DUF4265 domain-containing protein n=1 Tax=Embleya sp. NBC_00896 TaxID=2975961 RepID=UPI002F918C42|nr:DUF4265 domain-containing protein [Embleya sp. NBC_00896]